MFCREHTEEIDFVKTVPYCAWYSYLSLFGSYSVPSLAYAYLCILDPVTKQSERYKNCILLSVHLPFCPTLWFMWYLLKYLLIFLKLDGDILLGKALDELDYG